MHGKSKPTEYGQWGADENKGTNNLQQVNEQMNIDVPVFGARDKETENRRRFIIL